MLTSKAKPVLIAMMLAATAVVGTAVVWRSVQPTLVIQWPREERGLSDRLVIDDELFSLPRGEEAITVRVGTGTHSVRLDRFGYESVEVETNPLGWRDSETIEPDWTMTEQMSVRREVDAVRANVEAARRLPTFEQARVRRRLNQLRHSIELRDEPRLREALAGLQTSLVSPLDRKVLARDDDNRFALQLGDNRMQHSGPVTAVAFDWAGKVFASGGMDGRVRLSNAQNGAAFFQFDRHRVAITALQFVIDEVISIDQSGLALITSITERKPEELFQAKGELTAVAKLNSTTVAIAGAEPSIRIIDVPSRKVVGTIDVDEPIAKLVAVSDTDLVAISPTGSVMVFDSFELRLTRNGPSPDFAYYDRRKNSLTVVGSDSGSTWNFKNGKLSSDFKPNPRLLGYGSDRSWWAANRGDGSDRRVLFGVDDTETSFSMGSRVPSVTAYSPDADRAIVGTAGGAVLLLDLKTNKVVAAPSPPAETWRHCCFDRSAHQLAATTADGTVHIFRTFDWRETHTIKRSGKLVQRVLLSGGTRRAIVATTNGLRIHSLDDERVIDLQGSEPAALTNDERYLVYTNPTGEVSEICVYDLQKDRPALRTRTDFRITSLLPLPDAASIVIGTNDGEVTALSWKTGKARFRKQNKRSIRRDGNTVHQIVRSENNDEVLCRSGSRLFRWSIESAERNSPQRVNQLQHAAGVVYATIGNQLAPLTGTKTAQTLPIGSNASIEDSHVTPDGRNFAVCTGEGRLFVGEISNSK